MPSFIQVVDDKKVIEGDNVTLSCRVSGMPSPTVSWMTPDGQRQSSYMLEVTGINRSQAGEYRCEASNEQQRQQAFICSSSCPVHISLLAHLYSSIPC